MLPILIGLLLASNVSRLEVHAAKALDKIWDYTINITPYSDGSLSIEYHIEWANTYYQGGPELPATGSNARMLYVLCGFSIMLMTLVYGIGSRRKWERRTE